MLKSQLIYKTSEFIHENQYPSILLTNSVPSHLLKTRICHMNFPLKRLSVGSKIPIRSSTHTLRALPITTKSFSSPIPSMYLTQDELLGILSPIVVYWVVSGFYMILGSLDCLKKYRLNLVEEEDSKNLVSKTDVVKGVLFQHIIQAAMSFLLFTVSRSDEKTTATFNETSFIVLARQFMVALLVLDTYTSLLHRYMHINKFLYRHIHSQHHRLVVPYAFGAIYNHPMEGILSDMIGGALSFHISGMSPRMSIFFFSFATIKTIDDHCGLWFGWNLFQRYSVNNTAYHQVHHKHLGGKYNFSQPFFTMWDRMLGTYMPYTVTKRVEGGFEVRPNKSKTV